MSRSRLFAISTALLFFIAVPLSKGQQRGNAAAPAAGQANPEQQRPATPVPPEKNSAT